AGELAEALEKKSGIVELRQDLLERFAARRNVLQARSALAAVERLLAVSGPKVQNEFLPEVERIRSGAHAMAEIRLLNDYRRGLLDLTVDDGAEMERLLGTDGHHPTDRLGLDSDADPDTVRRELVAAIDKWRRRGEHPLASREVVNAATVVVRTCEGTLAALG
ncbi:MAG: GTP-binding protein, partial [Acidimicrobiia bacterium]|nr:GTP-binding protein [Acidimicrobiia bacterium]